ncbi:MAG: hypothetical protein RLZZ293_999 [Pseudomonadota bacterium]
MIIILFIIIIGGLIILNARLRKLSQDTMQYNELQNNLSNYAKLTSNYEYIQKDHAKQQSEINRLTKENEKLRDETKSLALLEVENMNLKSSYKQLQQLLDELKQDISSNFNNLKNIAINELKECADTSLRSISKENVVLPLENHFKDLQLKINELTQETKLINRTSNDLNLQARNLALALTKDSKKKGDFGEMILTNILESVGLKQHICYTEQTQLNLSDSKRLIPDVIVNLPHNRAVVIDSKNIVQLYYESIDNQQDKNKSILNALKSTIKNLSDKNYLGAVKKVMNNRSVFDYVIMFIPNEGLFNLVIEEDQNLEGGLLREAYQQNIFITGPSTLLVLLSIIERSWETYQIEERTDEIIKLSVDLVEKFKISLKRINELGSCIRQTGKKYDEVITSLDNGRGESAIAKLDKLVQLSGNKNKLPTLELLGEVSSRQPNSTK